MVPAAAYRCLEAMTQSYTGSYSTKGIIYYLDRMDKFINLDLRPYSNRKLALRLKHVTRSLTRGFGVTPPPYSLCHMFHGVTRAYVIT
jgi:hypothetical protein